MREYAAFATALTLSLTVACGEPPASIAAAGADAAPIIAGEACEADVEPSAVAILVDAEIHIDGHGTETIKTVVCTGTVIAPDVVLAAAHCLDASLMTFGFGTVTREDYFVTRTADLTGLAEQTSIDFPEDTISASSRVMHPGFNINNFGAEVSGPGQFDDIALLFLDRELDVPPAIVIGRDEVVQIVEQKPVRIAGWGQQTETSGGPFNPPPAGTVGRKHCATSTINELGTYEMQIGNTGPRKCHGDSGGPTYVTLDAVDGDPNRVIGVTSHAYDQSDCAKGGVDTRIDAYLDWLEVEMTTACSSGVRSWCEVSGIIPPEFFGDNGVGGGRDNGTDTDETPDGTGGSKGGNNAGLTSDRDKGCAQTGGALFALFALPLRRRRRRQKG